MSTTALIRLPYAKTKDKSILAYFSDGLVINFNKAETMINGYDEPEGVYLIKSGFVKACSLTQNGQTNLLSIHAVGEFLPLPWALNGYYQTGLSYVAMTDVTAIRASKDHLRSAMGSNSWLTHEVLNQAVVVIALYTQRIQTLQRRSARSRIISELLYLAERFGRPWRTTILIDAPISHQEISDSINMTRETASRALEILFNEELVGRKDHMFTILDLPKLQAALD